MSRILIAGTSSRSGKTTIACSLLASLKHRGLNVCAYKTGPDYIDTEYLRRSGKCRAFNLDTWLMNKEMTRSLFTMTSAGSDVAVIEGAMGLYDGGVHSTAEIAKLINAPVVLVVNARSSGESTAASVLGFREYDRDVKIAGVILNFTGSEYHADIIAEALNAKGIRFLGALRRDEGAEIPERHLGLLSAFENKGFDIERMRIKFEDSVDVEGLMKIAEGADKIKPCAVVPSTEKSYNVRVGVAEDEAFSFRYEESLMMLKMTGAEVIGFSPLHDEVLPYAEGYIFGGGYPEIFADGLAANISMLRSVRSCKRPILAECGGMMYLCRSIRGIEGGKFDMAGIIPADARMSGHCVLGYMTAKSLRDNLLCRKGETVRGHEFHYSVIEPEISGNEAAFEVRRRNTETMHFDGYMRGNVSASWLHVNFFGNPNITENFLNVLTSSRVQ